MPGIVPFIPLITSGLSFAGGMLKDKSQSSTMPTMDPAYGPLQSLILRQVQQRLNTSPDLSGYQSSGLENINKGFDAVAQAQDNNLSARGLSTSPIAGNVDVLRENARGGQLAQFMNSLPLLKRQLQGEDLGLASSVLGLGRGSTTNASNGGGLAGGFSNLAAMLGYFSGKGMFGGGVGLSHG